ncbi:ATP-binding protein [Pseudoroseomonas cervicalis]|uniref:sensor histidine kinase n=1 Tax=Teichococcus cervicalis TaxID=204525 RepID=UPI0022F1A8BB|nr:ATP-binding protein [Pseudoroseomonas cervicalis]WBV45478.1 ATP-binding protein [Pseudoroseomonas cervicalis]
MRGRPGSLAAGATLAFLAALLAAALLLVGLLALRNDQAMRQLETRALMQRAQSIARHLSFAPESGWRLSLPPDIAAAFSSLYGRAAYAVVDQHGEHLLGSNTDTPLLIPSATPPGRRGVPLPFTLEREGREWRGLALPVRIDGRALSIQVAEDLRHPDVLLDDAASGFLRDVAWVVLPVFLALGCATLWMLRRVKQPLTLLAAEASRISADAPGERLSEAAVPSELVPLVRGMNRALERIEAGQAEQREFVADAAHELRTPLAVLQAQIDLMADRAAAAALGKDLAVLERLVGQLLAIAALDAPGLRPDTRLDLRALTDDLAALLRPMAALRGITLRTRQPAAAVPVLAEEEALSQAIANLLENAIGHSPEGAAVEVTVGADGSVLVEDAGPGVPEHERRLVFRRFWRSRRRADRRRGGAGLGLSIVQRAALLHGGGVSVGASRLGGAAFRLWVPVLAPPRG